MAAKKQKLPITQIIIFVVIIGIVILIIKNRANASTTNTDPLVIAPGSASTSSTSSYVAPVDNGNVVIKYGSSGEPVKLTQQRLNLLIDLCKRAYDSNKAYPNMAATTATRINKIAVWSKLTVDGQFGSKTKALVQYVTGSESTTLNKVREKYTNFETAINS